MTSTSIPLNANPVIPPMAGPIPAGNQSRLAQLQANVEVLTREVDRARAQLIQVQNRLEGQVQQGEVGLFQSAQRISQLTQQLGKVTNRANEERNRANGLEAQLAAEIILKTDLQTLKNQLQIDLHVMKGERDNAVSIRADIDRSLLASNARIGVLEQQILIERGRARRTEQLGTLRLNKAAAELELEQIYHNRNKAGATAVFIGMICGPVGGLGLIAGTAIGIGSSFLGRALTATSAEERIAMKVKTYTEEIDRHLAGQIQGQ